MEVFISVLICFLSVYGIFHLLYSIACYVTKNNSFDAAEVYKVIPVTDNAQNLEAYIRYMAIREEEENVIILNMNNDEEVLSGLYILASEFNFVKVMTIKEYINFLRQEADE